MSLQLDNVNFGQELNDTFQQPDSTDLSFASTKLRNSKRTRVPSAIKSAKKRKSRAKMALKKANTHLRVVKRRFR